MRNLDDYSPDEANRELMELVIKAARRCAYDLAHAADWQLDAEQRKMFQARAKNWLTIFNPANGPKDYRHRMHVDISMLEIKIRRLQELCRKHDIDLGDLDEDLF